MKCVVVLTVLMVTACGVGDGAQARQYAERACRAIDALPPVDRPRAETHTVVLTQQAASSAEEAARLDSRWDELNRGMTALEDAYADMTSSPSRRGSGEEWWLKEAAARGMRALSVVRAECRKL